MSKRIRTNAKNRVKTELKTFFIGDDFGFQMIIAKTAEDAVREYMKDQCCSTDEIDGYRVFEAYNRPKEIQCGNAFVLT